MQKSFWLVLLGLFTFVSLGPSAQAAFSPVSVAVMPPIQFPAADYTITGFRASLLYGKQRDIYGLDLGVIGNITEQDFAGVGVSGIFNITRGTTNIAGLQLAGVANVNTNKTNVYGVQAALGANSNSAAAKVVGLQVAAANLSPHTDIYGLQVGVYNKAQNVYGLQIGLVNDTENLHGLQIGLLNFNHTGFFAVSPIINIGF